MYNVQYDIVVNDLYRINKNIYLALSHLFNIFKQNEAELYLVGGCVRDLLLDKSPKDYDLCTNLKPEDVKKLLEKETIEILQISRYSFIDTGLKHGTITIYDKEFDLAFEITTYRKDMEYSNNRHPDRVEFVPTLEEDLKRRDFTINSFAYSLSNQTLLMLDKTFIYDLKFGIIRTVGDPAERFEEDALRMLRAIRFAAQLNFSIEKLTYSALSMCAPLLKNISKERIRDELTKILMSDNPQLLEIVALTGMEKAINADSLEHPYLSYMITCEHQNPWHYTDVFHHTMDVVKNVPKEFELRWAAFFHDIGKPFVKKLKPGTEDHYRYIGHPEKSAEIALQIMDMLKFSNSQKELIHKYVLYHDAPLSDMSDKKFKQKLVEIGEENFLNFILLRQADAQAHKLAMSTSFAIDAVSICKDRFINYLEHPEPLRLKDLAINGNDLKALGLEGKEIGDTLNLLLEKVLENPDQNTKDNLIKIVERLKKNG